MSTIADDLPSIAVTGVTGRVGGLVARALAERGVPQRLLARSPQRAPELPGARVIGCVYEDSAPARQALDDVDVLFMVSAGESERRRDEHLGFISAARASGVRHVVYLSFLGADEDSTFTLARDHWATEEAIRASGMTWTFLRDSFYLDFFADLPGEDGVIRGPAGRGRCAAVARSDAAAVAARVMMEPWAWERRTLTLTGPQALTMDEVAETIHRVTGRPCSFHDETVDEAYESRRAWSAPQWQYDAWVSTYTAIRSGELDVVTGDVEEVLGRSPLSFEDVLRLREQ
ncbi:SDR family oxidoreductase [Actinomyces sp. B33]|uniref:SDR family oxidoreductase n=1 Tax=Actinomyces sp. B33 TaxID=2942131 RepID=UPI002341EA8C|nr:SDR family oxidoreductase [Actinomyces sp. B33]MDC4232560.1 SDR family oxidoreductase [Actinomyces sp. B33]